MKKLILAAMDANKVDEVIVTSDGQIFLPSKENAAKFHAQQKKLSVKTVTRASINDYVVNAEDKEVKKTDIEKALGDETEEVVDTENKEVEKTDIEKALDAENADEAKNKEVEKTNLKKTMSKTNKTTK